MQFPTQFPFLVIPTGAGPGKQRITINFNQDGKIKVYDQNGNLVDALGGPQGQFILYDASGNMVVSIASAGGTDDRTGNPFQPGITAYTSTSSINFFQQDGVWTAGDGSKVDISVGGSRGAIFLTPSTGSTPWFGAELNTNLDASSGIRPRLDITSPQAQSATKFSFINLVGGGAVNDSSQIQMSADNWLYNSIDMGQGIKASQSINANVSGITTTEVAVMTLPSMTFKNGRAYRVTIWGLQQSTTADTYFLHKLRGGTGVAGNVWKDQMRVPTVNVASVNSAVSLVFTIVNNTGADITNTSTWTTSCASGTGILAASPGNLATATIEDVGSASQWVGQPIS